ncbi:MAG: helix-turn-helix transcriptional regulator [Deltaproteobacteria bacterium]|nr:helix-turn-helix transcriptional regulator [Deltaproteobacteria bacterium]
MTKNKKRFSFEEALEQELKDPEFRFYFERARAVRQISGIVRAARLRAGLTQAKLAQKAKTSQAVIARLEAGSDSRIPSLDLLERIASALKARLVINFEYKKAT